MNWQSLTAYGVLGGALGVAAFFVYQRLKPTSPGLNRTKRIITLPSDGTYVLTTQISSDNPESLMIMEQSLSHAEFMEHMKQHPDTQVKM